jgi:ABC-2 type transport system permease protein
VRRFLRRAWAFVVRDVQSELSYRLSVLLQVGGLLWMLVVFWFAARLVGDGVPALQRYGGDYFAFVLLGYAPLEFLRVGVMGFSGSIREAQAHGTLEALLVTRAGLPTIVFGSVTYLYLRALVRAALLLTIGVLAGAWASTIDVPAVLVVFALAIPCFGAIGLLSASFVLVFKKGDPISLLLLGTSTLFAGLFFPVELLGSLQAVSRVLPLTYATEGVRLAASGHGVRDLLPQVGMLAAFCAVLLPLSAFSFRSAVDRARRDGTVTHY